MPEIVPRAQVVRHGRDGQLRRLRCGAALLLDTQARSHFPVRELAAGHHGNAAGQDLNSRAQHLSWGHVLLAEQKVDVDAVVAGDLEFGDMTLRAARHADPVEPYAGAMQPGQPPPPPGSGVRGEQQLAEGARPFRPERQRARQDQLHALVQRDRHPLDEPTRPLGGPRVQLPLTGREILGQYAVRARREPGPPLLPYGHFGSGPQPECGVQAGHRRHPGQQLPCGGGSLVARYPHRVREFRPRGPRRPVGEQREQRPHPGRREDRGAGHWRGRAVDRRVTAQRLRPTRRQPIDRVDRPSVAGSSTTAP